MGARLAWNNLLTAIGAGVVISSSSEYVGYPDDNLGDPARWKRWRSAIATTDQWVKFDLGSAKSIQVFAAINAEYLHAAGAVLRVQANATDSWGAPTVNDVLVSPTTNFTSVLSDWLSAAVSLRWVRFYFENPGAVNTYFELGAVYAGTYLEPTRTLSSTLSVSRVDPSVQRYAIGGQRSSITRGKFHQVSGAFPIQKASQRNEIRRMYETVGSILPVVLTLDPTDPSLTFYGTLQGTLSAEHTLSDLWNMPVEFVEDVR